MLRSPLALVVLALLYEAPMHPYRMNQMIKERGKDNVVNVAQRSSVQQVVHRLARDGLVEEAPSTSGEQVPGATGNYPARVPYRITQAGIETLFAWLDDTLAHPAKEFPRFTAALAFLSLTTPATAAELLETRRAALHSSIDTRAANLASTFLPRVLIIEEDYALAMDRAELAWLEHTLHQLRDGTLTWDTQRLIDTADQLREAGLNNPHTRQSRDR